MDNIQLIQLTDKKIMNIQNNSAVSFHYKLTDDDGINIDSSEGKEPLGYLHGAGNIIPGLEKALEGKKVGDSLTVAVTAAEGYGEVQKELIQEVPHEAFQGINTIELGMQFEAQTGQGGTVPVTVVAVTDELVTVDGNHPLAGRNLNFDVTIEEVRKASEEELARGHLHDLEDDE
jgi:FKBP-type peptidyl-prolyl cis-trans isomerase SlyD